MKDILIVVDMQNDFVNGALGSSAAAAIVPRVAARIELAAAAGAQVIFTLDTHDGDYMSTHEGKLLPVPHCIKGQQGWLPVAEIAQAALKCGSAETIEKPCFGSMELARRLADRAAEAGCREGKGMKIELCGLCTDICVVSNALILRAALPEADICVAAALCAGVTPARHEAALEVMRSCQIAVI